MAIDYFRIISSHATVVAAARAGFFYAFPAWGLKICRSTNLQKDKGYNGTRGAPASAILPAADHLYVLYGSTKDQDDRPIGRMIYQMVFLSTIDISFLAIPGLISD